MSGSTAFGAVSLFAEYRRVFCCIPQLIPRGRIRAGMFCFYTNQSNLLLTVYELLLLCAGFWPGGRLWAVLTDVRLSCAMALCIWVTHLIYQFVLVPEQKRKGQRFADFGGELWQHLRALPDPAVGGGPVAVFGGQNGAIPAVRRVVADAAPGLHRLCPAAGYRRKAHRPHGAAVSLCVPWI